MSELETRSSLLRLLNERRILNTVRMHRKISRSNLGREIRIATPTVMRIVDTLLQKGWLEEMGPDDSTGGRPAILLQIRAQAAGAIGIELGRVYARFVCVNLLCEVIHEEEIEVASLTNASQLIEFVSRFIVRSGLDLANVIGVGIAAPGPLDPVKGQLLATDDIGVQWHELQLVELFQSQLGVSAFLANDADAAALGETWFGLGNDFNHILFVLADAGVGAGMAIHRSIYCGAKNTAGEFSHTIVDMNGSLCSCGRRGCVNTAASAYAMMAAVREARHADQGENVHTIIQQAIQGSSPEREVVDRGLSYLSVGIFNFMQVFDPDIVILGGRTLLSAEYMVRETQERIRKLCQSSEVEVIPTSFGISAVAIGAAALALQHVYDHTQLID